MVGARWGAGWMVGQATSSTGALSQAWKPDIVRLLMDITRLSTVPEGGCWMRSRISAFWALFLMPMTACAAIFVEVILWSEEGCIRNLNTSLDMIMRAAAFIIIRIIWQNHDGTSCGDSM